MAEFARYAFILGLGWAVIALLAQALIARGSRRDYSEPAGSPLRGVAYIFTAAMLPSHKETISRHPLKFLAGVAMHVGVFAAFAGFILSFESVAALLSRILPCCAGGLRFMLLALVTVGFGVGLFLFIRRLLSQTLRAMSSPDDFIAILATCGLLVSAGVSLLYPPATTAAHMYTAALFVYMPLGKLRHSIFFFTARGSYGAKLGARGVYPPPRGNQN